MNTKWIKQNLSLVIALGAFVLLLAVLVWLQRQSSARTSQIESELETQRARLYQILGNKPFPSRDNIEVLRHDRERLVEQYQSLTQTVSRSSVPVPEMRPIEFSQLLARTIDRLRREAGSARVATPDNFAFGFERYIATLPCRNLPADRCREVLGLLTRQLLAVERLSDLLTRNRVQEIKQIKRVEVEPGTSASDTMVAPIANDPNALYRTLPFDIEFTCTTSSLRAFLNELSKSEWFFAVRSLNIDSESKSAETGSAAGSDRLAVTMSLSLVEFAGAPKPPSS